MRQAGRSIVVAVFLAMAGAAVAGQLEDGQAAIRRHDYANASRWRRRARGVPKRRVVIGLV